MNCSKCEKVVAFTRPLKPVDDAIVCAYCQNVIPAEEIAWSDGTFHFRVIGEVVSLDIPARILMENQTVRILDIKKILSFAKTLIHREPNLKAILQEFMIGDSNIHIEVLREPISND
jgi:hypothetical protein